MIVLIKNIKSVMILKKDISVIYVQIMAVIAVLIAAALIKFFALPNYEDWRLKLSNLFSDTIVYDDIETVTDE